MSGNKGQWKPFKNHSKYINDYASSQGDEIIFDFVWCLRVLQTRDYATTRIYPLQSKTMYINISLQCIVVDGY